jgi:hypothetical protein
MKELIIIISCTWKFAATFPVAIYVFKMSFAETILYTNIGGIIGIAAFTFFSKGLLRMGNVIFPKRDPSKRRTIKIFTRRNRRIIFLKNKFGLHGIVVLTPALLSIPIGVFLITRYFGRKKIIYLYLFAVQVIWSFVYTIVYTSLKTVV